MKKGDKIYCIKTRPGINYNLNTINNYYEIIKIYNNIISVSCDKNKYHISCQYSLANDLDYMYLFNDYFLTIRDIRKEKIKKINNFNPTKLKKYYQ